MGLETTTPAYIDLLNVDWPLPGDPRSQGDDHFNYIKLALKTTFPNINNAVNPTPAQLNFLVGATQLLSTTETTANAALARAGGTMAGDLIMGAGTEFYAANGTLALPSISFDGVSDTGWFITGGNIILTRAGVTYATYGTTAAYSVPISSTGTVVGTNVLSTNETRLASIETSAVGAFSSSDAASVSPIGLLSTVEKGGLVISSALDRVTNSTGGTITVLVEGVLRHNPTIDTNFRHTLHLTVSGTGAVATGHSSVYSETKVQSGSSSAIAYSMPFSTVVFLDNAEYIQFIKTETTAPFSRSTLTGTFRVSRIA